MLNGVTTYYVGNHFEWTGNTSSMVKYYYAGSQRVAMRVGSNAPSYLLGDHLGSTSLTMNSDGTLNTTQRYYPWGSTRAGSSPTAYQFTGQRNDSSIGLYFYNARYYDSALGRFIQADTIVPSPANPQSLNRYSYVLNNPFRYTDPSGHFTEEEIMQFFGVETWDEVEAFFREGGLLAGRWGWLEVMIRAKDSDELYGRMEGETRFDFIGSFIVRGNELRINTRGICGVSWQDVAAQYDYHKIFRYDGPSGWTFATAAYKLDYPRFYPDKLDWPGAVIDFAGVVADMLSLGMAGRVINALDVAYSGLGLVFDTVWECNFGAFGADTLTGEDSEDLGLATLGFVPYIGTLVDLYSLRRNVDQAIYGQW